MTLNAFKECHNCGASVPIGMAQCPTCGTIFFIEPVIKRRKKVETSPKPMSRRQRVTARELRAIDSFDPVAPGRLPEKGMILADRYFILEPRSMGKHGGLYKGYDKTGEETVLIKLVMNDPPKTLALEQRFTNESTMLARIVHPNLPRVIDFGRIEGFIYLIKSYARGETLDAYLKRQSKPSIEKLVPIFRQLFGALIAAEKAGYTDWEIRPSAIVVDKYGKVLIRDLGITIEDLEGSSIAERKPSGLTARLLAPEIISNSKTHDIASNVYALGTLLYRIICGRLPFDLATTQELLLRNLEAAPPRPRDLNPDISPGLERVILKSMNNDPTKRYRSLSTFRDEFEKAAEGNEGSILKRILSTFKHDSA
jgi:eukaryotic-like serine/threonine-protein kinase